VAASALMVAVTIFLSGRVRPRTEVLTASVIVLILPFFDVIRAVAIAKGREIGLVSVNQIATFTADSGRSC
jgi:hypothetical protein